MIWRIYLNEIAYICVKNMPKNYETSWHQAVIYLILQASELTLNSLLNQA